MSGMDWSDAGWPADPWEKGVRYNEWRLAATIRMMEHYAQKRDQQPQPSPLVKPPEKKPQAKVEAFKGLFE